MLTTLVSSHSPPLSKFKVELLLFQKVLDILNVRAFLHKPLTAHLSSASRRVGARDRQQDDPHQAEDGGDLVRQNNVVVSAAVRPVEPC